MKRLIVGAALAAVSALSSAELVNISTNATQTATQAAVACTIVDTGTTLISGSVILVVLAEGNGNPDLRVWSLNRDYVTTNNDWADGIDVTINGQTGHLNLRDVDPNGGLLYPTLLRAPVRQTDAAVFVSVLPGEAICASTLDKSGDGQVHAVTLSVTDMNAIVFKSLQLKNIGLSDARRDPREAALQKMIEVVEATR
jgi:hypothetical protein